MEKNLIRTAIIAALSPVLFAGCIKDADMGGDPVKGTAVRFATTISKTRAYDGVWEAGDFIGVYMVLAAEPVEPPAEPVEPSDPSEPTEPVEPAGPEWNATTVLSENMKYQHDLAAGKEAAEVVFSGVDEENTIVWPGKGTKVDFVAYYPWRTAESGNYTYRIDLSGQSSQQAIDLMWSNNVTGVSSGSPALAFEHKLTKLVFNVTDLDGTSLEGMVSTFDGLYTTAEFDLAKGEIVSKKTIAPFEGYLAPWPEEVDDDDEDGGEATEETGEAEDGGEVKSTARVEAIVLPGTAEYTLTFEIMESGAKAVFRVKNANYKAGKRYTYNISLKAGGLGFGAEGTLSSITGWDDKDTDGGGQIGPDDKPTGEPTTGTWSLGRLAADTEYTVIADGATQEDEYYVLPDDGVMTIGKEALVEVASVTISMKGTTWSSEALIRSVTVDGESLVCDDGDAPDGTSLKTSNLGTARKDFTFHTDGEPVSGDLEIIIEATTGPVNVYSFGVNTDITENNP